MKPRAVVVVGASAGGVAALLTLSATLPKGFPAPVLVVLHIGTHTSVLPALLAAHGNNAAVQAEDGQHLENGTVYVAPPDQHMMIEGDTIRLSRGPKEHHTRPAIDPLFRSAALAGGPRTIGVLLTGRLDDGTAGLQAIKDCGGIAVVQNPADAEFRDMPESALQSVAVDHCVPLASLATTLVGLVDQPQPMAPETPAAPSCPHRLGLEMAVFRGEGAVGCDPRARATRKAVAGAGPPQSLKRSGRGCAEQRGRSRRDRDAREPAAEAGRGDLTGCGSIDQ